MRPIKMSKIGLLAAAMYAILEERRSYPPVVGFSVLIDTQVSASDEYNIFGEVISGHIQIDTQSTLKKFKVYFNIAGDLVLKVTGNKTYYTGDVINIEMSGNVEIDFKNKSITSREVHEFKHTKDIIWSWQAVKGTALDIIGMILAEKNS